MMNIDISVIIPVYAVEDYIEECLRSVMSQSIKNIEIIVINDHSPDKSQKIINRLKKEDERIRVIILKTNIGLGFVRNIGIDAARGRYVWFLDSDDFMENGNTGDTVYIDSLY